MSGEKQIRLVYITSAMHSGSTLLDFILGSHSQICSVGEVCQLQRYAKLKYCDRVSELANRCACGAESVWDCHFWKGVDATVRANTNGVIGIADLELDAKAEDVFTRHNQLLFNAIALQSSAVVIVDSSKDLRRLGRLLKVPGLDISIIRMVRCPHGQIYSVIKRHPGVGIRFPVKLYNRYAFRAMRLLKRRRSMRVSYEKLATNSELTIKEVMRYIEIPFEEEQLRFRTGEHHNIAGNRMRLSGSSEIRLDVDWRTTLNWRQKLAISFLTSPGTLMDSLSGGRDQRKKSKAIL